MHRTILGLSLLTAAVALSGCSDSAAYHMGEAERQAMQPLPPMVTQVADAGFCRNVAHQDTAGLDDGTSARFYKASFNQCMAVFGPPALRLAYSGAGASAY